MAKYHGCIAGGGRKVCVYDCVCACVLMMTMMMAWGGDELSGVGSGACCGEEKWRTA